jgi:uncharacterized protein (UPF0264 family)
MPRLLVSVRNAVEAAEAVAGGASVIDVKEPARGPLGRADANVWAEVLAAVPATRPVSAALGELAEAPFDVPADLWRRLAFAKLGLAGAAAHAHWPQQWADRMARLGPGPAWVGVVYLDFEAAHAPEPALVIEAASHLGCIGLLLDTFDKSRTVPPERVESAWALVAASWLGTRPGRFVAVAGGLDADGIGRLRQNGIEPDLFAVRGAACEGGVRTGRIDRDRVASLAQAAAMRLDASSDARTDRAAKRPLAMQSARPVPVK